MTATKANPADKVERRKVSDLIPYARNSRTHSDAQVAQIAASIREWGWTTPILIDQAGMIIAGHGRVLAARKLGLESVPVVIADGWTDAQKRAYVIADNKLALNAGWDDELLLTELADLKALGLDIESTGFSDEEFDALQNGGDAERYSRKIEAPIYEPKEKTAPQVKTLYDESKTAALISQIDQAVMPEEIRDFLKVAAQRHTVFNFRNIAEFYCHQPQSIRSLMQASALVIIDFDQAIENGFVRLSKKLSEQYEADYPDAI